MDWHIVVYGILPFSGFVARALLSKVTGPDIRRQVRGALTEFRADFKDELIKTINGTYVRSAGSTVTGAEIERRLTRMEDRLEEGA